GNSRCEPAGHGRVGLDGWPETAFPVGSTQAGLRMPATRSGTAAARTACLSAIDAELSIMRSMSILSTDVCFSTSVSVDVVSGWSGATGRSRQPELAAIAES